MRVVSTFVTYLVGVGLAFGQGGMAGGGFGGGGGQGGLGGGYQGGIRQQTYDRSVQNIEQTISTYLNGTEIKNILTPGEYSEWNLPLKAGQVVIGEARSDAFDPALEIYDGKKVLASNDDRYPGDQRPLLLWRCDKDGDYSLRARCFHDKSGGQFFMRYRIYKALDVTSEFVEHKFDDRTQFLLRLPLKKGEIKQLDFARSQQFEEPNIEAMISPIGLPDIRLSQPLDSVMSRAVMAPVEGDYYVLAESYGALRMRVRTKEIVAQAPEKVAQGYTAQASTGSPALWSVPVKKGDFLRIRASQLSYQSRVVVAEQPDVSKYDASKPDTNPFYPKPASKEDEPEAFVQLPARPRDGRIVVVLVKRDVNLWVASDANGEAGKQFSLVVEPGARPFAADTDVKSPLTVGDTDYWSFDAKVGDVMTFKSAATGFAERITFMDPDLGYLYNVEAAPDQVSATWSLIAQRPGRYLVAVSSVGNGGGGEYALRRNVFASREFRKGSPAQGELSAGQVQVWKFTATPAEPLLVHWKGQGAYSTSIRNQDGEVAYIGLTHVDDKNGYGVLKVDRPTTFLLVLMGGPQKATYSIGLSDLPGYKG